MKRIITFMCVVLIGAICVNIFASESSKAEKAEAKTKNEWRKNAQKLAKKQLKEIKKEKWKTSSAIPLEEALVNYYLATDASCGGESRAMAYDVNNAKSISLAERRLLTNAQNSYVQEAQAMVLGEIAEHSAYRGETEDDVVIADVVTKIKSELQGDVIRAFTLYKENKDKSFWVRSYFILDNQSSGRKLNKLAKRMEKDSEISSAIKKAATSLDN